MFINARYQSFNLTTQDSITKTKMLFIHLRSNYSRVEYYMRYPVKSAAQSISTHALKQLELSNLLVILCINIYFSKQAPIRSLKLQNTYQTLLERRVIRSPHINNKQFTN